MKARKWVNEILFIAYCVFIVWYTILSRASGPSKADFRLFWAYRELFASDPRWKADVIQNLSNILFFVPFGLLFPVKKWRTVLLTSLVFSLVIEAVQYIGGFGLCELDDVICNTLGAMIGYWILKGVMKIKGKQDAN